MCGRFALTVDVETLPGQFVRSALSKDANVENVSENTYSANTENDNIVLVLKNGLEGYSPSYNVPPTHNALIIYQKKKNEFTIETLSFGALPIWAKPQDPTPVTRGDSKGPKYSKEIQRHQSKYFNCKKESLANNQPVWRSMKNTRCVVPIEGYFEWLKLKNDKIPYYVHSKADSLIFLAAFYAHNTNYKENFQNPEYYSSFTIITGPADKQDLNDLSWLHSRKPLMLLPGTKEFDNWLDPLIEWSDDLLDTCLNTKSNRAYEPIEGYKVSKDVGSPANQGKYLIEKLQEKSPTKTIDSFFKKRPKQEATQDNSPKRPKKEDTGPKKPKQANT